MTTEECEKLVLLWASYAADYSTIDPARAARYRRLARQMQDIIANRDLSWQEKPRIINLMAPPKPPPKMPKRRKRIYNDTQPPP
jgi:hypothetical protein